MINASSGQYSNAGLNNMPEPSPKLDPAADAVLRRMLATPPRPKLAVKKAASKRRVKGAK
jgi:hypothetical protein